MPITGGCDGPTPKRKRPRTRALAVAACCAATTGWRGQVGTTAVPRRIRFGRRAGEREGHDGIEPEGRAEEHPVEAELVGAGRELRRRADRARLGVEDRELHEDQRVVERVEDREPACVVASLAPLHPVHHVPERDPGVGIEESERAAGPVVAERVRAGPEREPGIGVGDLEAEAEARRQHPSRRRRRRHGRARPRRRAPARRDHLRPSAP